MGLSFVTGTWLLSGERLAAARRTSVTSALALEEPLGLLVDERLAPRPGDVLLVRVDSAGPGSALLPGDEVLVCHGEELPAGAEVSVVGLLVDGRCMPVTAGAPVPAAPRRLRERRLPLVPRARRLAARRTPAG